MLHDLRSVINIPWFFFCKLFFFFTLVRYHTASLIRYVCPHWFVWVITFTRFSDFIQNLFTLAWWISWRWTGIRSLLRIAATSNLSTLFLFSLTSIILLFLNFLFTWRVWIQIFLNFEFWAEVYTIFICVWNLFLNSVWTVD